MNKILPSVYLIPKEEGGRQITYFKHHVCSVITETSPEGVPLTHVHLTNGQVIDCALDHHAAVGAIEFYNDGASVSTGEAVKRTLERHLASEKAKKEHETP